MYEARSAADGLSCSSAVRARTAGARCPPGMRPARSMIAFVVSACANTSGSEECLGDLARRSRCAAWRCRGWPPKNMKRPSWAASSARSSSGSSCDRSSNARSIRSSPSRAGPIPHHLGEARLRPGRPAASHRSPRRARLHARSAPPPPGRAPEPGHQPGPLVQLGLSSGSSVSAVAARTRAAPPRCAASEAARSPARTSISRAVSRMALGVRVVGRGPVRVEVVGRDHLDDLVLVAERAEDARPPRDAAPCAPPARACRRRPS